jgi:RNA polymerase sigma-70 factor (ECF subfamily)
MNSESDATAILLERAGDGDQQALEVLFEMHRERLHRMVRLRMDPRVRGRIDASDVIQEAHLDAWRRLDAYLRDPKMPFFLWLRFLAGQKLLELHRHHLRTQRRDARKEVRLFVGLMPEASSVAVADQILSKRTSPSDAAARAEMSLHVQDALNTMEPLDREVLVLRHFEQLSNTETALELGIKNGAASQRYVRALERLEAVLSRTLGETRER